ncbi:MAG: hypothetical protein JKX73_09990, partial [Flavobacteriales bacterium]|nr:hypothetical protein [Flavobacteriales bacterium]
DLGTIGSPGHSMIYQVNTKPGLNFGFHSFDHLKFQADQTLYFDVKSPFTDLYYVLGPKDEEVLSVLHTQNINPLVNAGFNYQIGGTEGVYVRQVSKRLSFKAFTSIHSKNNRYHLNAQTIWNELSNDQSGGISQDSLFEDSISITRKNIPVNLQNASSSENQQVYELNQRYDFGKTTVVHVNDSVEEISFEGKLRIYHSALLDKAALYYRDLSPDTAFYPTVLLETTGTDNKVHTRMLRNTIGFVSLDLNPLDKNRLNGGIAGVHEYIRYNRYRKDTNVYNGIVKGFVGNSMYSRFYWKFGADFTLEGINADDYRWELKTRYSNKRRSQYLDFFIAVQQRAPAMIFYSYEGNHYIWKNLFLKQHNASVALQYTIEKHHINLGVRGDVISRFVFYNEDALPEQDLSELTVYAVHLAKDFYWKHFTFKNRIQYQFTSGDATLRIPTFISSHSAYYHNFLFKKALYMQIGVDLLFSKAYYADAYSPSTQQFYLQSTKLIGNYPYLDFFINAKINQAKLFVKMSHANQGFFGKTYYSVLHYPRNDMSFIVGISWTFND